MQNRPRGFSLLPVVIKNLLIINGLFFVATLVLGSSFGINLTRKLGLFLPGSPYFEPYQFVTSMFMHANLSHIFFNMFALWMFGTMLENVWGGKRFLIYYLITGFGASILHLGVSYWEVLQLKNELIAQGFDSEALRQMRTSFVESTAGVRQVAEYSMHYFIPTLGASGAVFGILLAYGMKFPNTVIYLYFAIPIKAKYFVILYGLAELYFGFANRPGDNVAHFAHLGGMLFGYLLIKYWDKKSRHLY